MDVRLTGADGLIGARAGQTAGFYVKLTDLAGGAGTVTQFKLYFTSVARAIAQRARCDPQLREHARRTSSRPAPRPTSRRSRPGSSTRTRTSSRA